MGSFKSADHNFDRITAHAHSPNTWSTARFQPLSLLLAHRAMSFSDQYPFASFPCTT
jgi:hypothetical protein